MNCRIVGIPLEEGTDRIGCALGPRALRAAGLATALQRLGHAVADMGDIAPVPLVSSRHSNCAIRHLPIVRAWLESISDAAYRIAGTGFPIFLGGDHTISAGTVAGISRRATEQRRPLFVLWLDAHTDFHTLDSTQSGNLHGVPLAYLAGQPGFEGYFPPLVAPVDPSRICTLGIRSVDPAEQEALARAGVGTCDMSAIDRHGLAILLDRFLTRVRQEDGLLHVSLDVDFLDPSAAPAVGTPVPGGATLREAHLATEMLHESGLVTSLDVVELNPMLDVEARTAGLMVDLVASLMGRRILGRTGLGLGWMGRAA